MDDETREEPLPPQDVFSYRTLGETLAAERRRRGLSVTDIAAKTRVRARMLQWLENDDWEHLPEPVYVKGYILGYASVLGIPAEPLLEQYRAEAPAGGSPRPASPYYEAVVPERTEVHAIPTWLWVAALAAVLLAGLVWSAWRIFGGEADTPPLPVPAASQEATIPVASGDETPVPGLTDEELSTTPVEVPEQGEPFTVGVAVEAGGDSWLRVTVDGETVFEGNLTGSATREWDASEIARVRIGRPSVVTVLRDGEEVEIPSSAEIPTVELTNEQP